MIVTIVTPTLNAVKYLKECIESVRGNESDDIKVEHVIVDGGSTDGTVELCESYGLRIIQGKDKGIFDAINKGSFNSSGELIGCLGADDVLLDGSLAEIVKSYRQSGKRWVVGGIRWIDEFGNVLGGFAAPPSWIVPRIFVSFDWCSIMHMATYMSRDFFDELGGFNIEYRVVGDFDMFARALSKAPYQRVARQIACYRRTGVNYSATHPERTIYESSLVRKAFGPKSKWERRFWRVLMRSGLSLRNPQWFFRRTLGVILWRLGLQEKIYI